MISKFKYISAFLVLLGLLGARAIEVKAQTEEVSRLFDCISENADTREKVDCYIDLARIYRQINKDSSLLFCDEAYHISQKIAYGEGVCDALYRKTQTLDYMGNRQEAIVYGKRCLRVADSIEDSRRMGKAYFKLAGLYRDTDEKQTAVEYYHKSERIFKGINDTSALVSIYNGIGSYYGDLAKYDSAVSFYHKSIFLSELIGKTATMGRILGNLGVMYGEIGDYVNEEKYLLLSLEYNIMNNDRNDIPNTYSRLGNSARKKGEYQKALSFYDKSDSALRITKDSVAIAILASNRSIVYRNTEEYDMALSLLRQALDFYKRQNYVEGIVSTWQGMSLIYGYMGMNDKMTTYADSGIILARREGYLDRIKDISYDLYVFYREKGKYRDALNAFERYQELSDSIFDLEKATLINDLRLKYEKEKDRLQILELEHNNLQRTRQRNMLLFTIFGVLLAGILIVAFLIYNYRKNKVISAQKIRQLEEEKKHLAARFLLEGEEKERRRVAMELHDNLGVLLSATKMSFSEIRDKSPGNAELITKASKFLEQASSDVRKISHNLMPGLLTKLGLYEALEELFENLNDQHSMDALMEVVGPKSRLDENSEIMIYRMVQEIVNNTLKHAEAKSVDMVMIVDENEINITYADDGKGFNLDETLKKKTLGLQSIRSRVKFLNGLFSIKSEPGEGTVYRICIPIAEGYCSALSE